MWLKNFAVCLLKGHDCSDLTSDGRDYTYCHRCGRIKAGHWPDARKVSFIPSFISPRPDTVSVPVEKMWR